MSQPYHPDTGTQPMPVVKPSQPQWNTPPNPPAPETYYPSRPPLIPAQPTPPKNPMGRFFLIIAIISLVLIVALGFAGWGIIGATSSQTSQNAAATASAPDALTATANAYATEFATANAALNNDLTQTAMTPTAVPTTPIVTIGVDSTQSSGVWSITVNSVKTVVSSNEFEVPKAGDEFIDINFTAANTDTAAHEMNPFYFTLRDDSGTSYDWNPLTIAANPDGTVVGGQRLRGDLTYEIPQSVHSLTLQFDSPEDIDNTQVVQWNLSV